MFSIHPSSLGTALRLLRARQGLSQGAVADRAGLTKAMLSSYEVGSKLPSFQSLTAILSALDRNFHDLQEALDEVREQPSSTGILVKPQLLGKALRALRDRQSLTQVALANRARLTKAMLSSYETGVQFPSLPSLSAILRALGVNFHDLQAALDQTQEPPSPKPARRRAGAGAA